ncbi:MAG: molecular chaperone HtpG, partial [Lachnospiraceae bacterium]
TSEAKTDDSDDTNAKDAGDSEVVDADVVDADMDSEDAPEEKDTRKAIYYVTDVKQQGQYINMFKEHDMDAVILDHNIDTSFITQLERRNEKVKFVRIDSDVTESMKEEVSPEELKEITDSLTETFKKALGNENLKVTVEKLKNSSISSVITLSEEGRRMQDMMKMYAMSGMDSSMFGGDFTLVLNANNNLVQYILEHKDSEQIPTFCQQLYDLAMMSNQPLSPDAMTKFIARSNDIMMMLAK